MPVDLQPYESLIDILSYKRGSSSYGELAIIKKYILPIRNINRDSYGNYWVKVGKAPVLWSCHTDTVHRESKSEQKDIRQKLAITPDGLLWTTDGSCLGADNGVGIWLMLEMLKAGVEGLYVFHREEEIGGLGSRHFAKENPKMLKKYKYAIAFDRRKNTSIITHQGYRTCSDAFADSLIAGLNLGHKKDDGGTFTDTKSYAELIPECTNVSAGFISEHSSQEAVDIEYVGRLKDALLKLDLTQLKAERDPEAKKEYRYGGGNWYGSTYPYSSYQRHYGKQGTGKLPPYHGQASRPKSYYDDFTWDEDDIEDEEDDTYLVRNNPDIVREVLEEWGIYDAVMDEVRGRVI